MRTELTIEELDYINDMLSHGLSLYRHCDMQTPEFYKSLTIFCQKYLIPQEATKLIYAKGLGEFREHLHLILHRMTVARVERVFTDIGGDEK